MLSSDTGAWLVAVSRTFASRLVQEAVMQEQYSFAQGEWPNCGHDWTAHSAWIANPGDKTCIEAEMNDQERWIPVIPVEDEPRHDNEHPFCDDIMCPCRANFQLIIEYVYQPVQDGLLTANEGKRIYYGKQV